MKHNLIARQQECDALRACVESDESEFVIVCGRRRIGKTFLVEQFFESRYDFKYVGGHNMRTRDQLKNFAKALKRYAGGEQYEFKDWFEAFDALEEYLDTLPRDRKRVIFIDEMPWMDTSRSNFVSALENFWNGWACGEYNILLVATGSATSWMTDKLIRNKGGLHNRIRTRIYLNRFTLKETEEYLRSLGSSWDRFQILQSYMLTGGVPYYISLFDTKKTLAENIDMLCFSPNGALKDEFDELFSAIFQVAESYQDVVRVLAGNRGGLTRKEISKKTKVDGGTLTRVLKNLERCDFIGRTAQFGNKAKDVVYRLTDYYLLFYFRFLEKNLSKDNDWWIHHLNSQEISIWMGLTFELICMQHHRQIKRVLGISGMATSVYTWRCVGDPEKGFPGTQIDMIIERADRMIHLCEMKFSKNTYDITNDYEKKLRERMWVFDTATGNRIPVVFTFVTTYGLGAGKHNSLVHSEVTMDDLFGS